MHFKRRSLINTQQRLRQGYDIILIHPQLDQLGYMQYLDARKWPKGF